MRHLNPPDLSTGCLVDERRINMGNPDLNFLFRQIQIENPTKPFIFAAPAKYRGLSAEGGIEHQPITPPFIQRY
jgi:hypothetical protein